jgi:hypothetical protein
MINNVQLTPLEALGVAIKAEIAPLLRYRRQPRRMSGWPICVEVRRQPALLEEAYARQFPDVKAWYPRTILPTQSLAPRVDAAPVL